MLQTSPRLLNTPYFNCFLKTLPPVEYFFSCTFFGPTEEMIAKQQGPIFLDPSMLSFDAYARFFPRTHNARARYQLVEMMRIAAHWCYLVAGRPGNIYRPVNATDWLLRGKPAPSDREMAKNGLYAGIFSSGNPVHCHAGGGIIKQTGKTGISEDSDFLFNPLFYI